MLEAPVVLHKVAGKLIEQLRMRWRVALHAEIFGRGQNSGAEITLPDAIDHHAGGGRRFGIREPFSECKARAVGILWQRMEESRHAGSDGFGRLEPISTTKKMCFARLFARQQGQRSRAVRIFFPKVIDLCVRLFPIGHCGSPITELGGDLEWRALFSRDFEHVADFLRQRIGFHGATGGSRADAEPAEIVVHMVIAVPAAVILTQADAPEDVIGQRDRFVADEDGLAVLITPPWTDVDSPGRFLVAVDSKFNGAGGTAVGALVVEVRFERTFRLLDVGGGLFPFYFYFISREFCVCGFHQKFAQRAGAIEGAARSAIRKIWIGEQFEAKRGDAVYVVGDAEPLGHLRGRVTAGEPGAVLLVFVALILVAFLFQIAEDGPFGLIVLY